MKFGEFWEREVINEWLGAYIQYPAILNYAAEISSRKDVNSHEDINQLNKNISTQLGQVLGFFYSQKSILEKDIANAELRRKGGEDIEKLLKVYYKLGEFVIKVS